MKQLVKNELIKLRAQKAYLVLSCLVLAIVVIVSFVTSVLMTPIMCLINDGREFITHSAGYALVVDYIYENPDSALAGVLRKVFRDPKSEADSTREQAEEYLEMELYGYYEHMMALAEYYDFRDSHDLPEWASGQYQAIVDLYRWRGIVRGLQEGRYTQDMMMYDYYMEEVMYLTFADFPYYMEYYYDKENGYEERRFYKQVDGAGVECSFAEVVQALVACMPACEQAIAEMENTAINLTVNEYYNVHIADLEARILEQQAQIAQTELELQNPDLLQYEIEFYEYMITTYRGAIEDYEYRMEAVKSLQQKGADPDGRAFEIVNYLLPRVLSARRDAIDEIALGEVSDEFVLLRRAKESSYDHQIRMLDKALVGVEYAYQNDITPEGVGESRAKDSFVSNLATSAFLVSAVTIVLSSMILSREFATGTVRLWVIRPKTRSKLLGSKMITLFMYVITMMVICFGITYVFALINHVIDLFFYGESTLFAPVYGVVFGRVVAVPAVLEHLWALVVITLPVLLYAALCLLISVLTKNGVIGIVLGMLVLMFASDIQAVALVIANYTGLFGYVIQATVLPYLSMDTLLGSAMDYGFEVANQFMELDILNLKGMLMSQIWGAMPYVCSSLVGAVVLVVHIAGLVLLSLFAFKKTQIKS